MRTTIEEPAIPLFPVLGGFPVKVMVLAFVVNAGCAMSPPADSESVEYKRADSRLEAIEKFKTMQNSCRAAGGTVYMNRSWAQFAPTLTDIKSARCGAPLSRLRR